MELPLSMVSKLAFWYLCRTITIIERSLQEQTIVNVENMRNLGNSEIGSFVHIQTYNINIELVRRQTCLLLHSGHKNEEYFR